MRSYPPHPTSRREFIAKTSIAGAAFGLGLATVKPGRASTPATRESRNLGVALVGLGYYSTDLLAPALRQTRRCHLAGIVTGTPAKAKRWSRDFDIPKHCIYNYETMHRLVDNPDIDIVYVVTPNGLHAEHAIIAAKAGKHVIVEKPMANTVAECDAIIDACLTAGVKLSLGYRLHFDPYHRELARHARDKDFGPFMKMDGERAFVMRGKQWRANKKLAGGGPLMDLGVYVIQGACMAAGEVAPVAVTAKEEPKTRPDFYVDVEEGLTWTMEFPNRAMCDGFTSYTRNVDHFRAEAARGWFELKRNAFAYGNIVAETSRGPLEFPPMNQQAAQMDDFAGCILENRETIVPGEMGRRDVQIITAIYEAMRTGKRTRVPVK